MPGEASVSILDIHDTEVMRIGDVLAKLNEKRGRYTDMEAFRREIIERFAEVGFGVKVKVFDTDVVDVYAFDIDVCERLEGTFDPDRQVHEVTNDVAGLGTGGVIKTHGGLSLLQGGMKGDDR